MAIDKDSLFFWSAGSAGGAWLLVHVIRLFRSEKKGFLSDAAHAQIVESLRQEITRKDEIILCKDREIEDLKQQQSGAMQQLAEIPVMRAEIHELELQISSLVELFNHLIDSGALVLNPEHQSMVFNMMQAKKFNRRKTDRKSEL